jgi:tRNA (guanine10-N2)-methyltransferase
MAFSFDAMLDHILQFSAELLVDNGRLTMWMPTANDAAIKIEIPTNPYLELKSVSIQDFGNCK